VLLRCVCIKARAATDLAAFKQPELHSLICACQGSTYPAAMFEIKGFSSGLSPCWLPLPLCCQAALHVFERLAVEHCIDPALRFHCPFKDCSCLMELSEKARSRQDAPLTCPACRRASCLGCGIAGWHEVRAGANAMPNSVAAIVVAAQGFSIVVAGLRFAHAQHPVNAALCTTPCG
jgi:hypothetical protein